MQRTACNWINWVADPARATSGTCPSTGTISDGIKERSGERSRAKG